MRMFTHFPFVFKMVLRENKFLSLTQKPANINVAS